ncbi:Tetraspannin [Oryctes borbonicus]|uniref:Tetraspannin n=1 Tax=Oryctes borbonicus TaxID=1629725 RepID=A0A0T6BH41_9SCAR|nr:Tetraspannin [Oryctes borbonicus]
MLKAYIGSVAMIVALQVLCTAFFIQDMHDKDSFKQELPDIKYIHSLQTAMECCGANDPSDWLNSTTNYPISCCSAKTVNSLATDNCHIHLTGCWQTYENTYRAGATICVGLIGFETLCAVAALIVLRSIKKKEDVPASYSRMS